MEKNDIIVIGGNHHNTLGIIRSLGYKGLKPIVILVTEQKHPYVCLSKYIQKYVILSSSDEIVDYLLKIRNDYNTKPVVFSCADFVTAILDLHQDKLSSFYHLPVGKGNVIQMMDKDTMARIANECGIYTPKTILQDNVIFSHHKKYIIKPLRSIEGSKSDIAIVGSKEELDNYVSSSHCDKLQIQEFIEKEIEFQLIGCSLNAGETIVVPGVSIILRQPDNTNTGFLKYVSFDEFQYNGIQNCKKFIQNIGYSGLFSIEFLRGKDGKDYFMEINMRNDGNSICVTASGINLPYIWYCHCLDLENWKQEASRKLRKVLVMPEFDDFVNVLKCKISIFHWIKDIRNTDCFMEYDKTDTKPFYAGLKQMIISICKTLIKKTHLIK